MRRGLLLATVTAAAALVAQAACTSTPEPGPAPGRSGSGPRPTESPAANGPRDSLTLSPPEGGSVRVHGSYPRAPSRCVRPERPSFDARYPGTLWIERSDDGTLAITVTLPFERYLEGIAEVPPSWPRASLEAQAIAARSYALATTGWSGVQGEPLDTPICSTAACQVYRGIPVPFDPSIRRWYRAVARTSGKVLLYGGRPAETVYFSTSNGRTYGNEDVFGSSPLPYLRPVVEHDDGASSTSRWRVPLSFDDLARFLHEADDWPAGAAIRTVRLDGSTVVVAGGGVERSLDIRSFRDAINAWAPCLEPDTYPPPSWKGTPLPVTVPSIWMDVSQTRDGIVLTGRGWGHGVGMVQWGAYGKALRGMSAAEILAFYYGGFRPRRYPEPGLIDVQVASGLTRVRLVPSAPGAELDGQVLDAGKVSIGGGDELVVATP